MCCSAIPTDPDRAAIALDVLAAAAAPAAAIASRQARRLAELLQAAQATGFYRALLRGQDLQRVPLDALPVIAKPALLQRFAEHVADPALTLDGLRQLCADPARVAEAYLGRYLVWESSGSSGTPGLFVQDATALAVYDALEATRRHTPRPWVRWLDPWYLSERFAFVGAIDGHFASQVSVQRLRLAQPWLAPRWRSFSILQPTAALVAQLDAFAPSILASYPTAAALLAEQAGRGALRCRPQEVWTGGEALTPALRQRITDGLGCALRDSYGASEFLPIAWECSRGRLHVNADWVILEPVDAQFRPVPPGQVSHTTLLTNLANRVQPLLRVDIGDRIALGGQACGCGSALPVVTVQGRCDDELVLTGRDGRPVTLLPLALTTLLEDRAGVLDFQLRQTGPLACCLTLGPGAPHDPASRARCRRVLADFAADQGVAGLRLQVRVADALPQGRSGKRQRIVAARG